MISETYKFPLIKDRDFFRESLQYCGRFRHKDEVVDTNTVIVFFQPLNNNVRFKQVEIIRAIANFYDGKVADQPHGRVRE